MTDEQPIHARVKAALHKIGPSTRADIHRETGLELKQIGNALDRLRSQNEAKANGIVWSVLGAPNNTRPNPTAQVSNKTASAVVAAARSASLDVACKPIPAIQRSYTTDEIVAALEASNWTTNEIDTHIASVEAAMRVLAEPFSSNLLAAREFLENLK